MFEVVLVNVRAPTYELFLVGGFHLPTTSSIVPSCFCDGLMIDALARIRARVSSIERRVEVGAAAMVGV